MSTHLAWRVFDLVLRPWMGVHLRVHLTGGLRALPRDRPVLLIANHESFWDGFLLREVQRRVLPWTSYHAVMLRRELDRRPWLKPLGAIGVEPGSVGGVRAMLDAVRGLAQRRPSPVLAFFPQGEIRPGDPRPLMFRPGAARVAEALAPATVLPVGVRLLPGKTARVDAFLSVGAPIPVPGPDPVTTGLLESVVAAELNAIRGWLAAYGENAAERWPSTFERLPRAPDASWIPHDVERWISRN